VQPRRPPYRRSWGQGRGMARHGGPKNAAYAPRYGPSPNPYGMRWSGRRRRRGGRYGLTVLSQRRRWADVALFAGSALVPPQAMGALSDISGGSGIDPASRSLLCFGGPLGHARL
jgi:hypothetical protein